MQKFVFEVRKSNSNDWKDTAYYYPGIMADNFNDAYCKLLKEYPRDKGYHGHYDITSRSQEAQ